MFVTEEIPITVSRQAPDKEATLVYQIEVQTQIKLQVGKFPKINKHAVQNEYAGETSCKKS